MSKKSKSTAAVPIPQHLSKESKAWWRQIVKAFVLENHHYSLLRLAAEAWDRTQGAREILQKEGVTYVSSNGEPKTHPAVQIERDARLAFVRILRELALDVAQEPAFRGSQLPEFGRKRAV